MFNKFEGYSRFEDLAKTLYLDKITPAVQNNLNYSEVYEKINKGNPVVN